MIAFRRSFQSTEELALLLRPDSSDRQELADRRLRGLMLIKRKNGVPKWVLKYQCPRTFQKRSHPLGTYLQVSLHEARQLGMEVIREEYGSDEFELLSWPFEADADSNVMSRANSYVQDDSEVYSKHQSKASIEDFSFIDQNAQLGFGGELGIHSLDIVSLSDTLSADRSIALGFENGSPEVRAATRRTSSGALRGDPRSRSSKASLDHVQTKSNEVLKSNGGVPLSSEESYLPSRSRAFISLKQFYLDHYLPYIKVAKRSWATDVSVLTNHILPSLGGYAMVDFKPFMIQEMVQSLVNKGLSASTCNRALIILRFMFNCGLRWQVLPKIENPCTAVKELPLNNKKERFLNGNEISALKLELSKSRNKFLPYIVQLLILTGCRRGEALNAQIQHFDLGRGDWVVPLPKAGKARHIPLNDMAIQTIRAAIAMKQSYNQVTKESNYLFPSPSTGEPFQSIFYSWDKARRAAHIDSVRMHDLRHSFASAMVNSGMTLYDVKEILGHTNIKTTERYAHLSNTRLRQAAESVTTFYDNQNWLGDSQQAN